MPERTVHLVVRPADRGANQVALCGVEFIPNERVGWWRAGANVASIEEHDKPNCEACFEAHRTLAMTVFTRRAVLMNIDDGRADWEVPVQKGVEEVENFFTRDTGLSDGLSEDDLGGVFFVTAIRGRELAYPPRPARFETWPEDELAALKAIYTDDDDPVGAWSSEGLGRFLEAHPHRDYWQARWQLEVLDEKGAFEGS